MATVASHCWEGIKVVGEADGQDRSLERGEGRGVKGEGDGGRGSRGMTLPDAIFT